MKTKITQDNYQEIVLKRSIIICWVLLAICLVIKLFGGNFFAIVCTNENFVKFCEFVDSCFVRHILHFIMFMFSSYLLIFIVKPDFKLKSKSNLFSFIYLIVVWSFKKCIEFNIVVLPVFLIDILDFVLLFGVLFINSKSLWKSVIAVALLFVFTLVSTIVKNIGYGEVITASYVVDSIIMIDYYIMLVLTAFYSQKISHRR